MHRGKARVSRVVLVVMDGVGVGALPDADAYGDAGSNSVGNVARRLSGLALPHLQQLGLGNLTDIPGVPPRRDTLGAWGRMAEKSPGKDTTTGHWEIAGVVLEAPFPTYPQGFPPEIISAFSAMIGRPVLGNRPASGTEIIEELGAEHLRTGAPIVYTSADSVFQIAAHEEVIPPEQLYEMCRQARRLLQGEHAVGRVIARPFTGEPGRFRRTAGRKDFSLPPPRKTILDALQEAGWSVTSVGKIWDIFAGRGIDHSYKAADNDQALTALLQALAERGEPGLIFVNCVDFDSVWGHRNDVAGYGRALEAFDARLPEVWSAMGEGDVLMLVGDHGCDPTTLSTDHSREYTPLLVFGARIRPGVDLGTRSTFADVAATIAEWFDVPNPGPGRSFAREVER